MALVEPATGQADEVPPRIRAVRLWCRRRADQKIARALRIETLKLAGLPHEEVRMMLGLTVDDYRRSRKWLNDAIAESVAGHGSIEEALRDHAERYIVQVLRFGLLRQQGQTRMQIRVRMTLSDDQFDAVSEWWRDAWQATAPKPGE